MSNILIGPVVFFAASATGAYIDNNVFTNFKKLGVTGKCFLKTNIGTIDKINRTIVKGAFIGFIVGAFFTAFPAVVLTANPKSCIILGALTSSIVGVYKAAVFLEWIV